MRLYILKMEQLHCLKKTGHFGETLDISTKLLIYYYCYYYCYSYVNAGKAPIPDSGSFYYS